MLSPRRRWPCRWASASTPSRCWWGLHQRGLRPDWIGHANVGNEWPETYAYRPALEAWLTRVGFPPISDVRYQVQRPRHGHYATLEENCLVNRTLPGISFGRKSCSMKWKGEPLDAAVREVFAGHIAAGGLVRRAIGYDAGPCDSRRGTQESRGPWLWTYPCASGGGIAGAASQRSWLPACPSPTSQPAGSASRCRAELAGQAHLHKADGRVVRIRQERARLQRLRDERRARGAIETRGFSCPKEGRGTI